MQSLRMKNDTIVFSCADRAFILFSSFFRHSPSTESFYYESFYVRRVLLVFIIEFLLFSTRTRENKNEIFTTSELRDEPMKAGLLVSSV